LKKPRLSGKGQGISCGMLGISLIKASMTLAAFNIEQYCQLILKYKLLVKTGTYPRTHSILRLIRELSKITREVETLLNDIVMLTKIEDAYIGSRYLPRRYERAEVEAMLRFVEERFRSVVENA
jgi:HEPN domain-containing protein